LLGAASADDTVFRLVRLADGAEFAFSELLATNQHAPKAADSIPAQSGKQDEAYVLRYLVPQCAGVIYSQLRKDDLWDKYYTEAPARQRQYVERYSIVRRV
jgi:hypothetical protein